MGFLDALGMAAVPAANVLAARNEGQIAAQQRGLQNAMALYQMRRQADNDQVNALYRASLGNAANARAENSRDPMISVTPTQTEEGGTGPSLANRVRASSLNAPLAPPAPPQQPQQAGATPEDPATSMAPGAEFPGGQVPAGALPTKLFKIGTQPNPRNQTVPIQQQTAQKIADLVASGVSPADANKQARQLYGYADPVPQLEVTVDKTGRRTYTTKQNAIGATAPEPSTPPVIVQGPNGQPTYATRDQAIGQEAGKVATTSAGGGIGSLSPQALEGMHQQAIEADKIMTAYEAKYGRNPGIVGAASGIGGAALTSQGGGFGSKLLQLGGNAALGLGNPEYQTYLNAQKRFGNIMGNIMSRRYTEHQGTLDTDLSGLQMADVAPTIALKQSFRKDLIDNFPQKVGATPAATGGGADINNVEDYLKALRSKKP